MDIYFYDPVTGAYIGQGTADPDPRNEGRYLMPAFSTEIAPPAASPGNALIFASGKWGYVSIASPSTPSDSPVVSAADVDIERDRRISSGFTFQDVFYQSDPDSRENIAGAATAALGAIISGKQVGDFRWYDPNSDFVWIALDNTVHEMDAQTMFAFGQAAMARKSSLIFAARAIKATTPIPLDYATNESYWP